MATLTVTARGQVTFRKKVMEHLGVKPGGKIELELLPDGRGVIYTAKWNDGPPRVGDVPGGAEHHAGGALGLGDIPNRRHRRAEERRARDQRSTRQLRPVQEEQQRGPDFLRLANALSALYPRESEEKRLLDGMLLAVARR